MSAELKLVRDFLRLIEAKLAETADTSASTTTKDINIPEWSEEAAEFLEEADYEQ